MTDNCNMIKGGTVPWPVRTIAVIVTLSQILKKVKFKPEKMPMTGRVVIGAWKRRKFTVEKLFQTNVPKPNWGSIW